ncbi:hypothetical protein Hanom_Chr06g00552711 [Helianthus anomalus]
MVIRAFYYFFSSSLIDVHQIKISCPLCKVASYTCMFNLTFLSHSYGFVFDEQVEHILNDRLLQFVNIDMLDVKVNCVSTHVSLLGCLFT